MDNLSRETVSSENSIAVLASNKLKSGLITQAYIKKSIVTLLCEIIIES
jgi:hypothetical protein